MTMFQIMVSYNDTVETRLIHCKKMMCDFDAECVAIVAKVRFFLRFFLIVATIVTYALASKNHTPYLQCSACAHAWGQ